ncbi:MAG: sulfite exporter TauE/SafE family protein [Oscillospiraceae bacterium]
MNVLFFVVSFLASSVGAITGIGGGIIIKPVLDACKILPISSISFLSGITVLSMAVVSILKNMHAGLKIGGRQTTFLAIGAAVGGILGKYLFQFIKACFETEHILGIMQSGILFILTVLVFFYMKQKSKIVTYTIENAWISIIAGLVLGVISSFLGIGGGPVNLVLLYFLFSMDTKTAAANSIYVIFFSQTASLLYTVIGGTIPEFPLTSLIVMVSGGILGGFIGSAILKRITVKNMQNIFMWLLIVIMLICVYNIFAI